MRSTKRSWWWIVVAALGLALLSVATFDTSDAPANNNERMLSLAGQFACPVCSGQSIAESDVPIAREIQKEIRSRLDQGQTDDQIRQYLGALYPDMDLRPKASGVTGLVWFLPVFAFVLALAGLVAVFRKWRNEAPSMATDADRAIVDAALATAAAREAATRAQAAEPFVDNDD